MAFNYEYPYTRPEANADWILNKIKELMSAFDTFTVINSIKWRGEWNITKQYPIWSIVDVNGYGYIAIKNVPSGIEITDERYWVLVANYSALYADFQNRVIALENGVSDINDKILVVDENINELNRASYRVTKYGAIADGTIHPLSERFATLEEAKAVYPFVTSLEQSIDYAVLQKMVNDLPVAYVDGSLAINATIVIPQGKRFKLSGYYNKRQSNILSSATVLFEFIRTSGFAIIEVENMTFNGITRAQNICFKFHGTTSQGVNLHDNWLKIDNCEFYNFLRGLDLQYCSNCYFTNIYASNLSYLAYCERDASFITFENCMVINSNGFIYAQDDLADGISNGLTFINCNCVLCAAFGFRILGWQAVYFVRCSSDLISGISCIYLGKCSDFNIDDCWIAGASLNVERGIHIENCFDGTITNCSIRTAKRGVVVAGGNLKMSSICITNNNFENLANNGVLGYGVIGGSIIGNKFITVIGGAGTDYPIYLNVGSALSPTPKYNIVADNIMANSQYTIESGTGSQIHHNIFGATL